VPFLSIEHLTKSYGGVHAVVDGNLTIHRAGTVHALMGANGSGKSTTLKVLSGQVRPDGGRLRLGGEDVAFHHPHDAVRAGISMVAQETALAGSLSITENVLMGRLERTGVTRSIDWAASHEHAAAVVARLGIAVDPRVRVDALRPDQRQLVEIARAISRGSEVVILDEPTSSLAEDRAEDLHAAIRRLAADGVTVVLVSHRLSEVFDLADEVTIMRDGATVAQGAMADFTVESLVATMSGPRRVVPGAASRPEATRLGSADAALTVRDLTVPGAVEAVDLEVGRGQIVGVAGLEGSGRSVLLEAVFGHTRRSRGSVAVAGIPVRPGRVRESISAGLAFLPPDRKAQGLVLSLAAQDNLAIPMTGRHPRLSARRDRRERAFYDHTKAGMRLRSASPSAVVSTLSGGNQQKIALGKWLGTQPHALLLDEPTRGVDVVAKQEIHARLRELADDGVGILVSSSENDELMALTDRIVVLFRGRVVGVLDREHYSDHALNSLAGGHR